MHTKEHSIPQSKYLWLLYAKSIQGTVVGSGENKPNHQTKQKCPMLSVA